MELPTLLTVAFPGSWIVCLYGGVLTNLSEEWEETCGVWAAHPLTFHPLCLPYRHGANLPDLPHPSCLAEVGVSLTFQ